MHSTIMIHIKTAVKQVIKMAAVAALVIGLMVVDIIFVNHNTIYVNAATKYSMVLDDLEEDPNFDASDYVINKGSTNLEVIQIAESSDDELFVYIYNPQADKRYNATYIRLSQTTGDNISPRDYKLTLLSSSGVYSKYLVVDVKVKADEVRYYDITCVFRKFIDGVDEGLDETIINTISQVPCTVAKVYTATTDNGIVTYKCATTEVVEIKDKFVGFMRYRSGYWYVVGDATDSHIIAFSCDYDIDHLIEAEVYFEQNIVKHHYAVFGGDSYIRGETEEKIVTLSDIDKGEVTITGPFGIHHDWERIQSTKEFLETESDISEDISQNIGKMQWVLRFAETEYSKILNDTVGNYDEFYTEVNNVSILRLHFLMDGKVYNLGVVDNYQTGSKFPINIGVDNSDYRWLALIVLAVFIVAVVIIIKNYINGQKTKG